MDGRYSKIALGAALLTALVAPAGAAHAVTVNRCLARKISNVGASLATRARCYAKDASNPNAERLASCLAKTSAKFTGNGTPSRGAFASAEQRPPCVTTGDQSVFDTAIAAYAAALDGQVANPGTSSRCDGAKLECVARYVNAIGRCASRAASGAGIVDDACLAKAAAHLSNGANGCVDKAEAPGNDCSATGDVESLAAGADQFVVDSLCELDPTAPGCPGGPPLPTATPTPVRTPTPTPTSTTAPSNDAAQICVDRINQFRATVSLPPLARWTGAETCVDGQALADSQSGTPHSAFGQCTEWAQNECPGWWGPPESMIGSCLQAMWNEGPGSNYATHGHYINMTNPSYTKVACGFTETTNGAVWATQDFR
jgi:hypothetical protein